MRQIAIILLALGIAAAFSPTCSAADEPEKAEAKPDNELVGTWKLVSAKYNGQENKLPEGITMLKHITPVQFMWAIYDKDGKVESALGGPYTLKGDKYEETPEYGLADTLDSLKDLKGKIQSFTWKIKGNKWYHDGKLSSGVTIEEVWERVEKK
jgi:hypothetical protein